jgi:ABC-type glycerol-3-phosphate transport system substrate-binding protein
MIFAGGNKEAASVSSTSVKIGIWPEDTLTGDIALHEGYVKTFNAIYPNMEVIPAYYKYATDTFVPLAESGQLPTIYDTWFTEPQKIISQGFAKDITAEVKALGWDKKMNAGVLDLLSKDGKIYGVPRDAYALGLMLNVDLFAEAGLVDKDGIPLYPKTWTELAEKAKIIKDKTGAAGLCLLAKDNAGGWHFSNIAWDFGATFVEQKNGKWVGNLNSKEAIAAMQYVKDLKWKYDILTADPTNEDWGTGFRAIGTGTAAMYIAAQDAVNQPTQVNGLPVTSLSLVPLPAGPKGQYSLMGGTPYMFSPDATSEQVTACLKYIEIMGKSPEITKEAIAGLAADAQNRKNEGIPVIPPFPAWSDTALEAARDKAESPYRNIDMRLFNDYYEMVKKSGNVRNEEPMCAQDLYAELTKVMQAVLTDKNANIQKLMDQAQTNFQNILDRDAN